MNKIQEQVEEFHRFYRVPIGESPKLLTPDRVELRSKLIDEEFSELREAWARDDLIEVADALGDLLYVVFGAAVEHGINVEPVLDEIHRSNLTKLGEGGKPVRGEDGKILKGPRFEPPAIAAILARQFGRRTIK